MTQTAAGHAPRAVLEMDAAGGTPGTGAVHPLLVPALLGAAALLHLIVAGFGLASVIAAAAMLAAGVYMGGHLRSCERVAANTVKAANAEARRSSQLIAESVPVWVRQIETARGQADDSVASLTRLFSELVAKLERVLRTSPGEAADANTGRDGMLAEIGRGRAELNEVIGILRSVQEAKDAIVTRVNANACALKEMTAEIRQIALQVRLLTLNAAIEAARGGEAGKPFAVIVNDMRQLAGRSADVSERVSRQVQELDEAIAAGFRGAADGGASVTSTRRAEDAIRQVVSRFESAASELADSVEAMARERGVLREDISKALVLLQFQDRVSQILAHVSRHLEDLAGFVSPESGDSRSAADWVERMARAYTTAEEFDNLQGAPRAATAAPSAVTYF